MRLLKCSLMIFFTLNSIYALEGMKCFGSNFEVAVSHKGWPFGLADNILTIKKNQCDLMFSHERLKYLKSFWHVDICREPVHVKKGAGSVEVIKKIKACKTKSEDAFCLEMNKLKTIIQDDGLIFATGSKEDLLSDHGKVYCSYRLLRSYVDGHVFSPGKVKESDFEDNYQKDDETDSESSREQDVPRPVVEGESQDQIEMIKEGNSENQSEEKSKTSSSSMGSF